MRSSEPQGDTGEAALEPIVERPATELGRGLYGAEPWVIALIAALTLLAVVGLVVLGLRRRKEGPGDDFATPPEPPSA